MPWMAAFATAGLLALGVLTAGTAHAQTGGSAPPGSTTPAPPASTTTGGGKAKLMPDGTAVPPANAPASVVNAIHATNTIIRKPYIYGGGHRSFYDRGYDCSGTVSFLLNAAGTLTSPMPSGSFMKWGLPGRGRWITTFANRGHMYAVVAGLRLDTSAYGSGGKGPRWRATKRPKRGFKVRHPLGF